MTAKQDVRGFYADTALRDRIDVLAGNSNKGEVSAGEREEYEGYVLANNFIAILQRQAR